MVRHGARWARGAAFLMGVGSLAWGAPGAAQEPEVTVKVRPERVRVGGTFVVTVRVTGAQPPEAVDVSATQGAEVVDVRERTSWAVGPRGRQAVSETDFVLRALAAGPVAPAGAFALLSGDTLRVAVPRVEAVGAPLGLQEEAPPRARQEERRLRDQGEPPEGTGRTGTHPYPGGGSPYPYPAYPGYPSGVPPSTLPGAPGAAPYAQPYAQPYGGGWPMANPYGPTGWGTAPPGRGWAATADGDPAWLDLVPRLERYATAARDERGLVTLEAGITPGRVYEGQQATLVATASFTPEALARVGPTPELFPPVAKDAWSVEIPYAPPSPASVGGRVQEAHTLMRAFFALAPGRLELDGVRLRYGVGGGGAAHAPGEELATEPLGIDVLPVPRPEAPPGWSGAVGRYRLAAWVEPEAVAWGEAAFLTVEVAGAGNVQTLPRPDPGPVWGAELRPVGERAMVEVRDGVVGGVKTFTWLVVPGEAALLRIGPVVYTFFDPWMEGWGQVASGEVILDARPVGAAWDAPGGARHDAGGLGWTPPWERDASAGTDAGWGAVDPPGPSDGVGAGSAGDAGPAAGGPAPAVGPDAGLAPEAPEARAAALLDTLSASPGDAALWLRLAEAFDEARPGEGWREWALLAGLERAPRDEALRLAHHGDAGWPGRRSGLAALPLGAGESGVAAASLAAAGLAALAWGLVSRRRGAPALAGLALLAAGALLGEPWIRRLAAGAPGVVVEEAAALRAAPSWGAPATADLAAGTAVSLGGRYGGWVEVSGADGARGWAEAVRVVPLEPGAAR